MKPIDLFRAGFWGSPPVGGKTLVFYAMLASPYIGAIEWDDATGFGAHLAAPAIPPTASSIAMAVSPNGKVLVTAGYVGGTVSAYKITEDGFGEKYPAPSVGISGNCYSILFSPNGQYVHLHQTNSPFLSTYEWNDITGFGAKISAPGGLSDFKGFGFSKDGGAIFMGRVFDSILPIRWTGSAYGADYPGISGSGICYSMDANPNDGTLVLSMQTSPYSKTVAWADATGAGAILPNPATPFPWYPSPVKFSPDGGHIAFHSTIAAPSLGAYEWTAGGIGGRLPDPPSLPPSGDGSLAWSNSGKAVFIGGSDTPFIRAWRFSSGSFGDKYPDPAAIPGIAYSVTPVTF